MTTYTGTFETVSTIADNPEPPLAGTFETVWPFTGNRALSVSKPEAEMDWVKWYLETLDALVTTIAGAAVEWATDSDGEPWVRASGKVDSRPALPAAVVSTFTKERDEEESTSITEYERVTAEIVILGRGDPKAREQTLRTTVERMATVENALYRNRTLSGTCQRLSVTEATPFSSSPGGEKGVRGSLAGAKLVCVIEKTATYDV